MNLVKVELTSFSNSQLTQHSSQESALIWQNVVVNAKINGKQQKIVSGVSGQVRTGDLVAILGPSGAGKSTLIKCLAGIAKPNEGTIVVNSPTNQLSLAYVPQTHELNPYLTVVEYITFAAKLKLNGNSEQRIQEVIEELDLGYCLNNTLSKCSGGQQQRLALAVEIVSFPNILIADEPTTGLDSHTALLCIKALRNLASGKSSKTRAMVITTIHQPSSEIFREFDNVYVMCSGKYIYAGSPIDLSGAIESVGITCAKYSNPAEYILDVAIGTHGDAKKQELCANFTQKETTSTSSTDLDVRQIVNQKGNIHSLKMFYLVFKHLIYATVRDPQEYAARLIWNLSMPLLMLFFQVQTVWSGCIYDTKTAAEHPETLYERLDRKEFVMGAIGGLFFCAFLFSNSTLYFSFLAACRQIRACLKEHRNSWYTIEAFFLAWVIINICMAFTFGLIFGIIYFWGSEFIKEPHVMVSIVMFFSLPAICFVPIGFIVAVGFAEHVLLGLMVDVGFLIQTFVLSGFVMRGIFLVPMAKPFYYVNAVRMGFEGLIGTIVSSSCAVPFNYSFTFEQVTDFVNLYNFEKKANLSALKNIPPKVEFSLSQYPWTRSSIVEFETAMNELNTSSVNKISDFFDDGLNFVLDEYNIKYESINENLMLLVLLSSTFFVIAYMCLKLKSRL